MPLGHLYGTIADIRNALYERGVLRSHSLGARTISIGNITTGGTGKTPLVELVSGMLFEKGEKVCVLTRGYGRKDTSSRVVVSNRNSVLADAETGGDEPVELAYKLLGKAVVVADADRVAAAKWAQAEFGITAFVLDDGYQNRRAKRDLDIVCIDGTDPFGGRKMLPFGRLREPIANLRRADAVVITRADIALHIPELKDEIASIVPGAAIFTSHNRISRLMPLKNFNTEAAGVEWSSLRSLSSGDEVRFLAFCALGNPKSFFSQVLGVFDDESMNEFDLAAKKQFPDHHFYCQSDIRKLELEALALGIHAFLTTAKDAVKLKQLEFTIPCFVVGIEAVVDDEAEFSSLL